MPGLLALMVWFFFFIGRQPQEIGIVSHQFDKDMDPEIINRKVSQEMFDSIIREVVEEIGVPEASLVSRKKL